MRKRFSILIIPISIITHLFIINIVYYYFNEKTFFNNKQVIYTNLFWLLIAYFTKIYNFNRYTKVPKIISQLFFQFSVFTLSYLSFYAIFDLNLIAKHQIVFLLITFVCITFFRILYFYSLRKYRLEGYNFRNVVVVGANKDTNSLINFFNKRPDFGFRYKGYFSEKETTKSNYLGTLKQSFQFIKNNDIDDIYCSIATLTKEQINEYMIFADNHVKVLKLIPDSNELYTKMKLEYYGYVPVLTVRKLNLENPLIKMGKRIFDIIFSLLIILFLLSWLTPILWFLIKKDSKGSLIFKQKREGVKGKPFTCYKFRSMGVNKNADKIQATKNDLRVTEIGKFLRKTSIDELPQFFNVLFGDMSVVGPRPHMFSQSAIFKTTVNKYMVRHFVKPGITGLAQVKGYRGEIETDRDIKNRVKYDIFYVENWSFFLDIKIILQTVGVFKGEDKAY